MACLKWTRNELDFLTNNYENMSHKEIAFVLGRSASAVENKCGKLGLKKDSKYSYDKNYFDCIDSKDKAYWLGFIYADGYINYSVKNGTYELGIELSSVDDQHLIKFSKSMKFNGSLKYRSRFAIGCKESHMCLIRFYCKHLVESLINYGVIQNKHARIEMPRLPKNLISHFIRGYFDGDGSIYIYKRRNILKGKFTSSSLKFMKQLQSLFASRGINSYLVKERKDKKVYALQIGKKESNKKFFEYLYNDIDENIYLDRKYQKYIKNAELLLPRYRLKPVSSIVEENKKVEMLP